MGPDRIHWAELLVTRPAPRGPDAVPELLSVTQVARLLKVHRSTVDLERKNGRLAFVRIGRRVLVSVEALTRYIAQHQQQVDPCSGATASTNTAATGWSAAPTPTSSPSPGGPPSREQDASSASARAREMLKKLGGD
jgi:excisionase family DNA binding protein